MFLRIAECEEHEIGTIGVPVSITTAPVPLTARVRLVDSANDRVRENLAALLREAADTIERGGAT